MSTIYLPDIDLDATNLNTFCIGGLPLFVWTLVFVISFDMFSFRVHHYFLAVLSVISFSVAYIRMYLSTTATLFTTNLEVCILKLLSRETHYYYVFHTSLFFNQFCKIHSWLREYHIFLSKAEYEPGFHAWVEATVTPYSTRSRFTSNPYKSENQSDCNVFMHLMLYS